MSSRGYGAVATGTVVGLVSLIVLGYVELHTITRFVVHGDLTAGLWFALFMLQAPTLIIPADIGVAMLIGIGVYMVLRRP
jgi:uncharacterized membrane protein